MCNEIIWLHEKALRKSHPVFSMASEKTKIIHVWDNNYYKSKSYSFKRLVFIYETLCDLPVKIIFGNTLEIISFINPCKVFVPHTVDTEINILCDKLRKDFRIEIIKDHAFSLVSNSYEFKRFFKYWNKAKKTAFLAN